MKNILSQKTNIKSNVVSKNHDDSYQIIQKQVDSYISKRKTWDRLRRFTVQLLLMILVGVFAVFYSNEIITYFKTLGMSDIDLVFLKQGPDIKQAAILKMDIDYFSNFTLQVDPSLNKEAKYAYLIHKFNNDFYGTTYNLSLQDERYLYTQIVLAGFNTNDLCGLNRPFSDDSTQSVKSWLFRKTSTSLLHSSYYNPVFTSLNSEILNLSNVYEEKLNESLQTSIMDTIKYMLVSKDISTESATELRDELVNILTNNPYLLEDEIELHRQLTEMEQEFNLRLGLFQIFLGKEYDVRNTKEMYGWLNEDYKGKNYFRNLRKSDQNSDNKSYFAATEFENSFKYNNRVYKKLDLWDETMLLYNPLRLPLEAKNVGLFGARRKSEYGRLYKHKGIDLIADEGTPVYPVKDGFVVYAGTQLSGHGNHIKISHDNRVVSLYSHLNSDRLWQRTLQRYRSEGPFWIDTNSPIASVGNTGNIPKYDEQYGYSHLHLEIEQNGKLKNPFLMFNESFKVYQE